ncbi:MAG: glutaredoxin family protein [Methanocellales archaeon]
MTKVKVKVYGLSTCGFCKRAKQLLRELKVEYEAIDLDLLEGDKKKEMLLEVKRLNPDLSYPTLVINDRVIVGFNEAEIREALK